MNIREHKGGITAHHEELMKAGWSASAGASETVPWRDVPGRSVYVEKKYEMIQAFTSLEKEKNSDEIL
ncbi:MAG: hypothetical protein IJA83_11300 [Clostridia bacterium]|nr:hypothetical protein [Clostridia bacterium]